MITVVEPTFEILTDIDGIEQHIERCGRVCYKSEDRITDSSAGKFVRNICRRRHESVLEHASITAIIKCSRACSHQLVRHRIAAYCLAGDTEVVAFTSRKGRSPKRWTLKQLYDWSNDPKRKGRLKLIRLRSLDKNGRLVPGQIRSIVNSGKQPVFKITTRFGRTIEATANHSFLTPDGWRRLSDIQVGDQLLSNGTGQAVMSVFKDIIISIESAGIKETFDIEMSGPNHNFIANGIVVHNSQESQRYCDYGKRGLQVICPPRIGLLPGTYMAECYADGWNVWRDGKVWEPTTEKQRQWVVLVDSAYSEYLAERSEGIPPEDARYVLPNATKTEVATTFNLRQWRHFFRVRCDKHAQWEIREIAKVLLTSFAEAMPSVFEDLSGEINGV